MPKRKAPAPAPLRRFLIEERPAEGYWHHWVGDFSGRDAAIEFAKSRVTSTSFAVADITDLDYALWSFKEAGQASDHDCRIGHEIAVVLCGGDGPAREVTEQDLIDLERDAFVRLLGIKETQDRITHMLTTGKPLRN